MGDVRDIISWLLLLEWMAELGLWVLLMILLEELGETCIAPSIKETIHVVHSLPLATKIRGDECVPDIGVTMAG